MSGRLPDFLVLGAQKAGSTWFTRNLRRHPGIHMPMEELTFFTGHYDEGPQWYADHFTGARPEQLIGEGSPGYLWRPGAAPRILSTLGPAARHFVSLRDPRTRAFSAFRYLVAGGRLPIDADFATEFEADTRGLRTRGHYAEQIERYVDLFGRDQIFVSIMERDLGASGAATIARAFDFLGLDPTLARVGDAEAANVGSAPRRGGAAIARLALAASRHTDRLPEPMHRRARSMYRAGFRRLPVTREINRPTGAEAAMLDRYFRPQIDDLEDLLEGSLTSWWPRDAG